MIPSGTLVGTSTFSITPSCPNCLYDNGNGWAEFDPIQVGTYEIKYCWDDEQGGPPQCCTKEVIVEAPLPVTFLSADYDCSRNVLSWSTASEQNNDFFTIKVGSYYNEVGILIIDEDYQINGNGNSNTLSEYEYNLNISEIKYIELWQTDFDGTTVLLDIIAIECEETDGLIVILAPNPINEDNSTFIIGEYKTIQVYDMLGKEIFVPIINNEISGLSSGIYIVVFNNHYKVKLIIN